MKREPMTATVTMPEAEPSADSIDMLKLLEQADRAMRSFRMPFWLWAEPSTYEQMCRESEARRSEIDFGVRPFASWLGLSMYKAPALARPPEKPFRSRPRRTYVRAKRQTVKADRATVKAQGLVSWRHWKGRKVPDRTGYPPGSVFVVNPSAIIGYPWGVT